METINLASDFSPLPHGRHPEDGPYNGETFRVKVLAPAVQRAIREGTRIIVNIDGVKALGSSFGEEAFGGLVRMRLAPKIQLMNAISIQYSQPWLRAVADDISLYMKEAAAAV